MRNQGLVKIVGCSFALALVLLSQLSASTVVSAEQGWLGVQVRDLESRDQIAGSPPSGGVAIDLTFPKTPAAEAGLSKGDLIIGVNGHGIQDTRSFLETLGGYSAGSVIDLTVIRGVERQSLQIRLAEKPNNLSEIRLLAARIAVRDALVEFGPQTREYSSAVEKLGGQYKNERRYTESIKFYREALSVLEILVGPESIELAPIIKKLAHSLHQSNRHAEAESAYLRLVKIIEKAHGAESEELAGSLVPLADVLYALNRYGEALQVLSRSLSIQENAFGFESNKLIPLLDKLGPTLERNKQQQQAVDVYRRHLALLEKQYGWHSIELAPHLTRLAKALTNIKRYQEAELVLRRSITLREAKYGTDGPSLSFEYELNKLASVLNKLERYQEAEKALRRSISLQEEIHKNDKSKISIEWELNELAWSLKGLKRYEEAAQVLRRSIALQEEIHKNDKSKVSIEWELNELAWSLERLERYEEAAQVLRRSIALQEAKHGGKGSSSDIDWELHQLAYVLERQGAASANRKFFLEALPIIQRAVALREAKHGPVSLQFGTSLGLFSKIQRSLGEYQSSLNTALRSIEIKEAQKIPDSINKSWVLEDRNWMLGHIGWLLSTLDRHAEAERYLRKRIALIEKEDALPDFKLVYPLTQLSFVHRRVGRFLSAEQVARKALRIAEAASGTDPEGLAHATRELGNVLERLGRFEEAERQLRRAVERHEQLGTLSTYDGRGSLEDLGNALNAASRYVEAEQVIKRSIRLNETFYGADHPESARVLSLIGRNLHNQQKYEEAEKVLRRSVATFEKAGLSDSAGMSWAQVYLGRVLFNQSNYEEAGKLFERAIETQRRIHPAEQHPNIAAFLADLSDVYLKEGRLEEAKNLMRQNLAINKKVLGENHHWVGYGLSSLANLSEKSGQLAEAKELFERALAIETSTFVGRNRIPSFNVAWLHNRIGLIDVRERRLADAMRHYRKAVAIIASRALGAQRRHVSSYDEGQKALYVFRNFVDTAYELHSSGHADGNLMWEAFEVAQWLERTNTSAVLSQMASRFAAGDNELAQRIREFQDLEDQWRILDASFVRDQRQAASTRVDKGSTQIRQTNQRRVEKRMRELNTRIHKDFPKYAEVSKPEPLRLSAAQKLLHTDEALLLYVSTYSHVYIWSVTKSTVGWFRVQVNLVELSDAVAALRCGLDVTAWSDKDSATCKALLNIDAADLPKNGLSLPFDVGRAHQLYLALFGDIENWIAGKKLIVVPAGPLTSLPFQVLVTDPPAKAVPTEPAGYRNVAWLAHRHAVTVLPAISSLRALRVHAQKSAARKPYIAFGNPLLSGRNGSDRRAWQFQSCEAVAAAGKPVRIAGLKVPGFIADLFRGGRVDVAQINRLPPLPETANELCEIAKVSKAPKTDVYLGERATESYVKAFSDDGVLKSARIVHFATHGLLAGEVEKLSEAKAEPGLVLTPPTTARDIDDGLLTASEIMKLNLDADWVVLSACNTASGDKPGAAALSGLARAFFYAGARALLVSHWEVYSDAAVQLVTHTMRGAASTKAVGRAEALRSAMLALIKSDDMPHAAHPAFWSPFVVVGEGAR